MLSNPEESLLEWVSTIGHSSIERFRDTYTWAYALADRADRGRATRALTQMERLGHVDIDWEQARWWVTPTALTDIAGGNCLLVGARTRATRAILDNARERSRITVTCLPQPVPAPNAMYVEVSSDEELRDLGRMLGAQVAVDSRRAYSQRLASLDELLVRSQQRFTASGLQARQLDPRTLTFEPVEIRGGRWWPGCFEQRSRGVARYLFVDESGQFHNTGRQIAIHAEIRRARTQGKVVYARGVPLGWDPSTERLVCGLAARLPLMHERSAILCSGLLPEVQNVVLHEEETLALVYEGVAATTYNSIRKALDYPPVSVSLPTCEDGA